MSYTPPAGNAVDFSWGGALAYSPPPGSAADFAWLSGYTAAGFLATRAGVPSSPSLAIGFSPTRYGTPSMRMVAQGFCASQYGAHGTLGYYAASSLGVVVKVGMVQMAMRADGFLATTIGVPSTPTPALGSVATQYGTPRGWEFWQQRSLPPTTVIPGAFSPVNHIGRATGLAHTRVGHPMSFVVNVQPLHWTTAARGALHTRYGIPSTAIDRVTRAAGFLATRAGVPHCSASMFGVLTRYGVPTALVRGTASGGCSTGVGVPASLSAGRAAGFACTAVGKPSVRVTYQAAPTAATRYGKHGTLRSATWLAYALGPVARVPVPRGWQRFNYPASGGCGTHVGMPTCVQRHRVLHIAPITRVGTPTLMRAAQC